MLGFAKRRSSSKATTTAFYALVLQPYSGDEIVGYITAAAASPSTHALVQRPEPYVQPTPHRRRMGAAPKPLSRPAHFPRARPRRPSRRITAVISGAGSNIHNLESRPDRTNARMTPSRNC